MKDENGVSRVLFVEELTNAGCVRHIDCSNNMSPIVLERVATVYHEIHSYLREFPANYSGELRNKRKERDYRQKKSKSKKPAKRRLPASPKNENIRKKKRIQDRRGNEADRVMSDAISVS